MATDSTATESTASGTVRLKLKRLPERKYYAISDVAKETELQPYVLRFWEKEFPMLRPKKSRTNNNRQYQRRDIELIYRIKQLLYDEGYTIEGARQRLKAGPASEKSEAPALETKKMLGEIRTELEAIVALLQ